MSLLGIATSSQDSEKTGGLLYELFWHLWWRKHGAEFLLCLLLAEGGISPGQQLYFRSARGKWFSRDGFIVQELYSQVSSAHPRLLFIWVQRHPAPGGLHKAEQSALRLRICPPPSLGDVPGRWGNWLTAYLTLWKDKYMKNYWINDRKNLDIFTIRGQS